MIGFLKKTLPQNSALRWALSGLYHNPLLFIAQIIRSIIVNYKLCGELLSFKVRLGSHQSLNVNKASSSKIILNGILDVSNWEGVKSSSFISLSHNATLIINGDLIIGPGVYITICKDAVLELGGKKYSSASGITYNSRIMVEEYIKIGFDTIIAWDVFITDSDWHDVSWDKRADPVLIGDHVWISHDVSILKGSIIPDGCVVGAKSLVTGSNYTKKALIAGIPAKVLRTDIDWTR